MKNLIIKAISQGGKDFYHPKYEPLHVMRMETFVMYLVRNQLWESLASGGRLKAQNFNPQRNSRLGTKTEYTAFLGVLIKKLVEIGWVVEEAWNAVCNDSTKLGHYWSYDNLKRALEMTGSREIAGFCDLANTLKILAEDKEAGVFWIAGGYYFVYAHSNPLACLHLDEDDVWESKEHSVGWIILEK